MKPFRKYLVCPFLALLFFARQLNAEGIEYAVSFEGIENPSLIRTLKASSQLVHLKKHPPSSMSALHFRAQADLEELKKVLHAFGYYEARLSVKYEEKVQEIELTIEIDPGTVYTIGDVSIDMYSLSPDNPITCKKMSAKSLGLVKGNTSLSKNIILAELKLLARLAECSYPLAKILKREVLVDGDTKQVAVSFVVDTGPFSYFGPLCIEGLRSVNPKLIDKKLEWKIKDPYSSSSLDRTQYNLIDTGLFSSVLITHDASASQDCEVPIKIELTESKHRSINMGVSYQTFFGPGLTFGWENRNIDGLGRKLSIQGDVTKKSHSGIATLYIPDFFCKNQNYIWQAQAMHESITAYSQRTYNLLTRIERQFGRRFSSSLGLKGERLYVTNSVNNGRFLLIEIPIYSRWSSANSLLDPTRGGTMDWSLNPSINVDNINTYYLAQELRLSHYYPVFNNKGFIFAHKLTLGSILCRNLSRIPVSKRFLGGSEEDLRGYKYKTVSQLNEDGKPIGGQSALYYSVETRFRFSKTIGLVPFFDIGNVYAKQFPTFHGKWRKSVGLGFRYFSFIGPIRFDIGVPLNRRKGLDPSHRILVSIGQAF
jgi:translocation and assembly module TamA